MISSTCCFVKKIIKSREFSRTLLCRLWLIFWNYRFETISRTISIFWISFYDFLIRTLLKNVFFFEFCFCCCYSVSVVFNLLFLFFVCRIQFLVSITALERFYNLSWIVRIKQMSLFLFEVKLSSSLNRRKINHFDETLFQRHVLIIL